MTKDADRLRLRQVGSRRVMRGESLEERIALSADSVMISSAEPTMHAQSLSQDETELARLLVDHATPAASEFNPANPLKIMLMGDSIGSGIAASDAAARDIEPRTGYRAPLWNLIHESFVTSPDVEFVGPTTYNPGDLPPEAQSHASYRGFATFSFLPDFLGRPNVGSDPEGPINGGTQNADGWGTLDPDIGLIMLGVNDLFGNRTIEDNARSIEQQLRDIIEVMRHTNEDVVVLMGTLTPYEGRVNSELVPTVNQVIRNLVQPEGDWAGSTTESPIHIVDHYVGENGLPPLDLTTDFADGLHPNSLGEAIMTANWWEVLEPIVATELELALRPDVSLTTASTSLSEAGATTELTVTRTGDVTAEMTVQLELGGSAVQGVDYSTTLSGQVVIPAGLASATFSVSTLDDLEYEPQDTIAISLSEDAQYARAYESSVTISVVDNDYAPVVTIRAREFSLQESESGAFYVNRFGNLSTPLTVEYTVTGTADASDFQALTGVVEIAAGSSAAFIDVQLIDDLVDESVETLQLQITPVDTYLVSALDTAQLTIIDNDAPLPRLSVEAVNASLVESSLGRSAFRITRSGDLSNSLAVNYQLLGSAEADVDYAAPLPSIVFPVGVSSVLIDIHLLDDDLVEGEETIVLDLVANSSYELVNASALITVLDDDSQASIQQILSRFVFPSGARLF